MDSIHSSKVCLSHSPGQAAVAVGAGAGQEGGAQPSLDTVANVFTFLWLLLKRTEICLAPYKSKDHVSC